MKDMNGLVLDFLEDIFYAERAGIRAMTKMARSAAAPALKDMLTEHRRQSETQVSRLEDVFAALGQRPKAKQCTAMDGLIQEAEDCIEHAEKGPILDAALIACAQAMEHYEIARYGALVAWTRTMGKPDAAETLQAILDEEKAADARYNELALNDANPAANEEQPAANEPTEEPAAEPVEAKATRKAAPKAKAAATRAGKPARAAAVPEPELALPAEIADAPEAAAAPAPDAKRKAPARKTAAKAEAAEPVAPEPEPEPVESDPAPAAKPKRGGPRRKA